MLARATRRLSAKFVIIAIVMHALFAVHRVSAGERLRFVEVFRSFVLTASAALHVVLRLSFQAIR